MKAFKSFFYAVGCAALAGCATSPEEGGSLQSYAPRLILRGPNTQVPMTDAGNGQRLVRAEISGHTGLFAVDTGADYTILTPKFAQEIGVFDSAPEGWLKAGDARKQKVRFTKITSLTVGDIDFLGFYAPIVDVRHINQAMHTELAGILGNNLLREVACKFDWKQNVLILDSRPSTPPADAIPIAVRDNRIFIPATVNGQAAEFALDTGAYRSLIAESEIARLRIPDTMKSRAEMLQVDIAGSRQVEATQVKIESFKLGNIERNGYEMPAWSHSVIGMDLLQPWVVTIDCRKNWMTFTAQ